MHTRCITNVVLLFTLQFTLAANSQTPPPMRQNPPLTQEQQEKLKERDRLIQKAQQLSKENKSNEAVASFQKAIQLVKEVYGDDHPIVDSWLTTLSRNCELWEEFTSAKQLRKEIVERRIKRYGRESWQTTDAQRDLIHVGTLEKLSRDDRARLFEATQSNEDAVLLFRQGKTAEAIAKSEAYLLVCKRLLGEEHPDYAAGLNKLAQFLISQKQHAKAEMLLQKSMGISKKLLGEKHPEYASNLNDLALLYYSQRKFIEAEMHFQTAMTIFKESLGEKHPDYAATLNNLAHVYRSLNQLSKAEPLFQKALNIHLEIWGERHLETASSLYNLASLYAIQNQYTKAEPLYLKALEIQKELMGEKHSTYALSLNKLALLYKSQRQYAKAEPLLLKASDICKECLGEKHPFYATSLSNLAGLYHSQHQYAKAELLYLKALNIRKEVLGEKHSDYAASLSKLAGCYQSQRQYAKAEPLFQKALNLFKEVFGENHPDYAASLNDFAVLNMWQGQYAKAESLFQKSLDIQTKIVGEQHPDYATSLSNLADLYMTQLQYTKAEPLFQKASEIFKDVLGEKHPYYAASLSNLGGLYKSQYQYAKAEPLFLKALSIKKDTLGDKHPDYAIVLNNLGSLYFSQEQYGKAEPFYQKALDISRDVLGEKHPDYAASLNNLALLYHAQSTYVKAEPLYLQSIRFQRELLEYSAAAQSEQQQQVNAQHLRLYLDNLCVASASEETSDDRVVYAEILAWKGATTARQRLMRQVRTILQRQPDREITKLLADLDTASQQLATLSLTTSDHEQEPNLPQRLQNLSDRREQLEKDLSRKTEGFRRLRELQQMSPANLQKRLSDGAVLIDFFEYRAHSGKIQTPNLVAFIITSKTIERIELGKSAPLAEAIDRFRGRLKRAAVLPDKDDPATILREVLWVKLEPHIVGAQLVLISPDGPLHRLPFTALPGKDPKKYLIEETQLVVLPVPQMLVELLETQEVPATAKLLALGDVDFDAEPGSAKRPENIPSLTRAGSAQKWNRLPATEKEIVAIEKTFRDARKNGTVELLRRDKATEAALREKVESCHYLHLATHGFFAPKDLKAYSANRNDNMLSRETKLIGYHPGTLSGLVLAGANNPKADDDGVLTALEVGDLNLTKVDLAVLSACETGLGEVAGGEGVLGLQRAFQVAGAKSVITTLWQIPDEPTRILMERFYETYWKGRDGKKFGKLAALREAQLWMLREGKAHPGIARGLERELDVQPVKDGRLPPYYWAAFVLSGDWR